MSASASDNDSGENCRLTYMFVKNDDDRIDINSSTGVVTVAQGAIFMPEESLSMYVVVHDMGTPQLNSADQAFIKVIRMMYDMCLLFTLLISL